MMVVTTVVLVATMVDDVCTDMKARSAPVELLIAVLQPSPLVDHPKAALQHHLPSTVQVSVRPDRQPQGKAKHIPPKPEPLSLGYDCQVLTVVLPHHMPVDARHHPLPHKGPSCSWQGEGKMRRS